MAGAAAHAGGPCRPTGAAGMRVHNRRGSTCGGTYSRRRVVRFFAKAMQHKRLVKGLLCHGLGRSARFARWRRRWIASRCSGDQFLVVAQSRFPRRGDLADKSEGGDCNAENFARAVGVGLLGRGIDRPVGGVRPKGLRVDLLHADWAAAARASPEHELRLRGSAARAVGDVGGDGREGPRD
jgi:hypothetical protein